MSVCGQTAFTKQDMYECEEEVTLTGPVQATRCHTLPPNFHPLYLMTSPTYPHKSWKGQQKLLYEFHTNSQSKLKQ